MKVNNMKIISREVGMDAETFGPTMNVLVSIPLELMDTTKVVPLDEVKQIIGNAFVEALLTFEASQNGWSDSPTQNGE